MRKALLMTLAMVLCASAAFASDGAAAVAAVGPCRLGHRPSQWHRAASAHRQGLA